jgi:hypothetical protein
MLDEITAKAEPSKPWAKASEGQAQCVLVDVIDLGMQMEQYMNEAPKAVHKCALVWQIDEVNPDTGKPFEMNKEFTVSMGGKANLRKFLGVWRGKTYTDAEATEGAPLHKLYGVNGLMQIEHKQSKQNPERTYAQIVSVTTLPKSMGKIKPTDDYERSAHWAEKLAKAVDDDDAPPPDENGQFEDANDLPF